jgi:hypothetical protein
MKIRKVINRPIHLERKGVNVAGGLTGAISANVGESGANEVASKSEVRIVQKDGRTEVTQRNSEQKR